MSWRKPWLCASARTTRGRRPESRGSPRAHRSPAAPAPAPRRSGRRSSGRSRSTASSPCQAREPVTFHTTSRAQVSNGMLRPSCCTGSRRRDLDLGRRGAGGRAGQGERGAGRRRRAGDLGRAVGPAACSRSGDGALPRPDARPEDDDHAEHEQAVADEHDVLARVLRDREDRRLALAVLLVARLEDACSPSRSSGWFIQTAAGVVLPVSVSVMATWLRNWEGRIVPG